MFFKKKSKNEEVLNNILKTKDSEKNEIFYSENKGIELGKKPYFSKIIKILLIISAISVVLFFIFVFFIMGDKKNNGTDTKDDNKINLNITSSNIDL